MKNNLNRLNSISVFWNVIFNGVLAIFALLCIYPLLLILGTSFTSEASIQQNGYNLIPKVFSIEAYRFIFSSSKMISNAYGVTIFVTVVGTICSVLMAALYAYPLSRKELKYRGFFTMFMFITMLFGGGLIPWYMVCTKLLNLSNHITALIIPPVMNVFYVIVLRTFFQTTIPDSLIESAKIDGATDIVTFYKIVLPLSKPGLATIGIFSCLGFWNDWFLSMMFITKPSLYNLQFLLQRIMGNLQFLQQNATKYVGLQTGISLLPSEGARMAICIIVIGPIIFAYPFFQKYFVKGLTIGAVKG